MKNRISGWKKLFHGPAAVGVTALVIVAVILLNVAVTALSSANLWRLDLTSEAPYQVYQNNKTEIKHATIYRLMDETVNYMEYILEEANKTRPADEPLKVDIVFCADPDILMSRASMRYVYYTALNLEKAFPDAVQVSYCDVVKNPSSVDQYRSTSYSNIYQSNIIVASGSEFRVTTLSSYYTYDEASSEPTWYSGEQQFLRQILAVTGAEAPICCLTVNHGEPFATMDLDDRESWGEYRELLKVIEGAGYEVQYLDLEKEEIPEHCRLILTLDPQTDFVSSFDDPTVAVSETTKLDEFLDQSYSFMVLMDADSPRLRNLEEYLEVWGITYARYSGTDAAGGEAEGNYRVEDLANSLDGKGLTFMAQYAAGGTGSNVLKDLSQFTSAPKIVFGNAMPIVNAKAYQTVYVMADTTNGTPAYTYGHHTGNDRDRAIFEVFHAGTSDHMAASYAVANGEVLKDASGAPVGASGLYQVLTLSVESRPVAEGSGYTSVNQPSFVCAVGSVDFVSDAVLGTTSYGNTDALLAILRGIGQEVMPVGLSIYELYSSEMDAEIHAASHTVAITVALAAIPAVLSLGIGIFVLVRRRVRR